MTKAQSNSVASRKSAKRQGVGGKPTNVATLTLSARLISSSLV